MKTIFDRGNERRNTQAHLMALKLKQVHCAVTKLLNMGWSVMGIRISERRPQIEIQYETRCQYLGGVVNRGRQNIHGDIEVRMTSKFGHCDLVWMQPEGANDSLNAKGETQWMAAQQA